MTRYVEKFRKYTFRKSTPSVPQLLFIGSEVRHHVLSVCKKGTLSVDYAYESALAETELWNIPNLPSLKKNDDTQPTPSKKRQNETTPQTPWGNKKRKVKVTGKGVSSVINSIIIFLSGMANTTRTLDGMALEGVIHGITTRILEPSRRATGTTHKTPAGIRTTVRVLPRAKAMMPTPSEIPKGKVKVRGSLDLSKGTKVMIGLYQWVFLINSKTNQRSSIRTGRSRARCSIFSAGAKLRDASFRMPIRMGQACHIFVSNSRASID